MTKLYLTVSAVFFLSAFVTQAADMKCISTGMVRCPCPAGLYVKCDGYEGTKHMANNQSVKSAKFSSGNYSFVIENPKSGANALVVGRYTPEVQEAARKAGIPASAIDDLRLDSFTVDSEAKLYEDAGKSFGDLNDIPLAQKKGGAGSGNEKCRYQGTPLITRAAACGAQGICVGNVVCNDGATGPAACLAIGDKCPSASACAADQAVSLRETSVAVASEGPGGSVSNHRRK